MKRVLWITIMLLVCGCGEAMMPAGYTGLILGAEKDEVLEVVDLQGTKPTEPVNDEGWESYKTIIIDPLFSNVKLNFRFGKLSGVYFDVGPRCSKDVYHGLIQAMNKKLVCVGKEEKRHETFITSWKGCATQKEGVVVVLLYGIDSDGTCISSLMLETDKALTWKNPGEKVDI